MQAQRQQILDRCKELFTKAEQLYGVNMKDVQVRFDLKGRSAGQAARRGFQYYIRFNQDMMTREAFDHLLNATVPHEIAHIVTFKDRTLGHAHDSGWQRICIALGGNGERTHEEEVVHGKGYTYEYTTNRGNKVRVGDKHHSKIQRGAVYTWKRNIGAVDRYCEYWIVGHQGRTLPNPKHVPAPPRPAAAPAQVVNTVPAVRVAPPPATPLWLVNRQPVALAVLPQAGESKAAVSRRIMLAGYRAGKGYETIITEMMAANGYDRQLARATFKANAAKVGIPSTFC